MRDEHLTWIVPCRRAVVKRTITYHNLMVKWKECLSYYQEKLKQWYNLADSDFEMGIYQLQSSIDNMNPDGEIFVSRTSSFGSSDGVSDGNTVDSQWEYVRLWKGPLRVLLEEKVGGEPVQREDEIERDISYRSLRIRLVQNSSHKEVTNANAEFLMGDVVEFPIFKFLFACNKEEYKEISFNPNGSFLCGTSLLKGSQPYTINADPKIHDNLIAMRFQLLLNLVRGAFYSLDPVFSVSDRAPIAEDGGLTVYARGLVYGAIFRNPTITLSKGYWQVANLGWGYKTDNDVPNNVPTRDSLTVLCDDNPPITPGIACSPASLTLCCYMLNLNSWGKDSINKELTSQASNSIYWDKFEQTPVNQDELLGRVQSENRQQVRERLKGKINEILKELGEPPPLACPCISNDNLVSLERAIKYNIQSARNNGRLDDIWTKVNDQLCELSRRPRDSEANQRNTLWDIHRCFYQRFVNLRRQLEELKEDPAWHLAELPVPDIDVSVWPAELHPETEPTDAQTLSHGIGRRGIESIKRSLKEKRDEIDRGDAYRDMSNTLHDISTFKLRAHELALVKVYPFDQLMTRNSLPLSGRISAYDPLSGIEQFPEGGSAEAQLFFLEATGTLAEYTRPNGQEVQACGLGPFNWKEIENNSLYLKREGRRIRYWENNRQQGEGALLSSVWRIRNEKLRGVYPGNEHEGGSGPSTTPEFKPFVVLKLGSSGPDGPLGDYQIFYSDRAVPFPTFKYADEQGNFPRKNDIPPYLNILLDEVTKELDSVNNQLNTTNLTESDRDKLEKFKKAVSRRANASR